MCGAGGSFERMLLVAIFEIVYTGFGTCPICSCYAAEIL